MAPLLWLGLVASPAHAWEHVGVAWDDVTDFPIAYVTNDVGGADCLVGIGEGVCASETAAAFASWETGTCTSFGGLDVGTAVANSGFEIGNGLNQVNFGFDDMPGVLGVTTWQTSGIAFVRDGETYYAATESDIFLVSDGPWLTHADVESGVCSDAYSVQSVLAHEIGHLAGLGHSCDEGEPCNDPDLRSATMYWQADACDAQIATPNVDDVAGLEALYGPAAQLTCGTSGDDSLLGIAPLTLNCVVGADSPIDSATWTFGDGTTDSGVGVTHTWTEEGTYTVTAEVSGTSPDCGVWESRVERKAYVRACSKPEADFRIEHILGIRYDILNDTEIDVVGCVSDVKWALYEGDTVKGDPVATFENWEFEYEFPSEGTWTMVLNVGGPAGTTAAKVTLDVYKHAGIHPFGCNTDDSGGAWLLFLPLIALRRRRLPG